MPTDAADRCKPLEEQYEKAQRELSYLVHEQKEEEKLVPVIVRIPKYKKNMLEKIQIQNMVYLVE